MKYHYSSYWHTWSRVLSESAPGGPILEVNLTPIPNAYSSTWENHVQPIILRLHGTSPDRRDKFTDVLPGEIMQQMEDHLPWEKVQYLLTADILAVIDLDVLRGSMRGGGIPLAHVLRPPV